jgi:hypothetical protein
LSKEDGSYQAVLVDFSVASPMFCKRCGLTGTPPFVHRDVHRNNEWYPVPEYDKTSLGLTLAVFLAGGVIPWHNLNGKGSDDDAVYNARNTAAISAVSAERLSPKTAGAIQALIDLDKTTFRHACNCLKTRCTNNKCGCRRSAHSGCSVLCTCNDCQNKKFFCLPPQELFAYDPFQLQLDDDDTFTSLLGNSPQG